MTSIKDARSGTNAENLQEIIDASVSAKHATLGGQQQYQTGEKYSMFFNGLLPEIPSTIFDPQCAAGIPLKTGMPAYVSKYGFEIDKRYADTDDGVERAICNCVDGWEILDDLYPNLEFECTVANPPFGLLWPTPPKGIKADSTAYTWQKIMERASTMGFGWFISNHKTIERLKIHEHPRVYLYQKFPAGVWKNCEVEIGVVHWDVSSCRPKPVHLVYQTLDLSEHAEELAKIKEHYQIVEITRSGSSYGDITEAITKVSEIVKEEAKKRPPFNVYLDKAGMLQVYLSTRFVTKRKIKREEVLRLSRITGSHPLTFTADGEGRKLLSELIGCGIYTIQPEAKAAIEHALAEVNRLAAPIMGTTDFESVGYCDEEDHLVCIAGVPGQFTKGKNYALTTNTYRFTESFEREKPHYNEEAGEMYTVKHKCQLSGTDRYIAVQDDSGKVHRFMDRPQNETTDHDETVLWKIFQKPVVRTVAETHPEAIAKNKMILATCEMLADFTFYPGQLDYLARVGVKPYGIIAGAVGTGKTLAALSLIQMKGPERALIIAPQGTVRASCNEDDEDEDGVTTASQWFEEIRKFCPGAPVFKLFSYDDYHQIVSANSGNLPSGIYVTYWEAFFRN